MKKTVGFTLLLIIIFAATTKLSFSQKRDSIEIQTLFDSKKLSGYSIGIGIESSKFDGNSIINGSINGGIIFDHKLLIGLGIKGILNMPLCEKVDTSYDNSEDTFEDKSGIIAGGYIGILIEPILRPSKKIHLSFPILIGGGGLYLLTDRRYVTVGSDKLRRKVFDRNYLLIFEPGIDLEANVFRFMKASVGIKYRYAPNLNLGNVPKNAFNGFSTSITFKFGKF